MFTKINYPSNKICTSVLIASSVTRLLSFQKHVQKRYCNQIPYFQGAKKKRKKFGIRKKVKKYVYEKVGNGSTFQKDGGYINISSTFLF